MAASTKHLSAESWRQADPQFLAEAGLTLDEWARAVLRPELPRPVPADIRQLFETARGTLLYGAFYLPVLNLAADQLYRVADAALNVRAFGPGGNRDRLGFAPRIGFAVQRGWIAAADEMQWMSLAALRNESTHATAPRPLPPRAALHTLELVARSVGDLFAG